MEINEETIRYLEKLSKIELTGSEMESATKDIGRILEFMSQIDSLDVSSVPDSDFQNVNVWREDAVIDSDISQDKSYVVPKAVN